MPHSLNQILLLFGMAMFFGLTGGKIFRFFKIPQVVGYIIIGIILGVSCLGVFDENTINRLGPFMNFALGLIGFMIGGEIKLSTFKKYGKSIFSILLSEGLLAFFVVGFGIYLFTRNFAVSILLGALASATAPAATVDVIWEYRAKGILTTTVLAIVALDDALSLVLYAIAKFFAISYITGVETNFLASLVSPAIEISSSLLLGFAAGICIYLLIKSINEVKEKESFLVISLGAVLLTSGLASIFDLDLILCNMALGMTLANISPKRSHFIFDVTKQITTPVYVIFFVLVGARLQLGTLASMGGVGILYVVLRTVGKMSGSYFGAWISKSDIKVRKYLGTCLFSQAGIAIGLAIAIYRSFSQFGPEGEAMGLYILNIITATTLIVQIIGPPSVKWSLKKADEIGKGMNEEEILDAYHVSELMAKNPKVIHEGDTYNAVIKKLQGSEYVYFPVVDKNNIFRGAIQLDNIRSIIFEDMEKMNVVIRAVDMMVSDVSTINSTAKLSMAKQKFDFEEYDYLPVLGRNKKLEGVLPRRTLKKFVKRKLWEAEMA